MAISDENHMAAGADKPTPIREDSDSVIVALGTPLLDGLTNF